MLICRCAWHRRYYGYPLLSGVVSWRGFGVRFTDGICPRCLERFRSEHRTFLTRRDLPTDGSEQRVKRPVSVSSEGAA